MATTNLDTSSHQITKILTWKANGLLHRKTELSQFLVANKIEIALISETHLTSRSYAEIKNYKLYTCNLSGSSHSGAAIYISNAIAHHEAQKFCSSHIQAACISAKLHCGTSVTIAAIYSPPRHHVKTSEYEEFFGQLGEKWIVGGDFNAKHHYWGSRIITPKGRELYQAILNTSSSCISKGEPTYWPSDPHKLPDCIDFFVTRGISSNYIDVTNIADLSSDHSHASNS